MYDRTIKPIYRRDLKVSQTVLLRLLFSLSFRLFRSLPDTPVFPSVFVQWSRIYPAFRGRVVHFFHVFGWFLRVRQKVTTEFASGCEVKLD